MGPRASVIIVATTDGPRLRRCLERLAAHESATEFETIVVLVGAEAPGLTGPGLTLLASPVNLGLAGSLNLGSEIAQGEFLVSLHDDAEPLPGWLDALVAAADAEPDAGAVGSLVLNPDGSVQAAGWVLDPDGSTRPPWGAEPPPATAFTRRLQVDYAPSCSLLIRRLSWEAVGGADERFFPAYYVDVDLALALRTRGHKVLCEPASVVVHERGASTVPERAVMISARNRERLWQKWGELLPRLAPGQGQPVSVDQGRCSIQARASDSQARERQALENQAQLAGEEAAGLRAQSAALTSDLETVIRRVAELEAQLTAARARSEELEARSVALEARSVALEARSEKLRQIEAGGWWQLRARLLPLLRLASALRRGLRRPPGSAAPESPVKVDE